jgi:3,4-dihydroxy 2-butanone 4-phosphate synthase/GTP cyclohydrolase II
MKSRILHQNDKLHMDTQLKNKLYTDSIEDAILEIKAGKPIIIVDDEDRENEGDFVCAAECITPEIINFMATHGRGLICAPITTGRAKELGLNRMVDHNTDLHGTAFTVSIDYKLKGCTTGISAYDRATGIKALTDPTTEAHDYSRPGHIFPLIAKDGGVLRRTGHTEAAVDLAKMAGFFPAGVLVEILNKDGSMARLPQLKEISKEFGLKIITIKDLVAYRMQRERLVEKVNEVELDTKYGKCSLISFKETNTQDQHLLLKYGTWGKDEAILTRVHAGSNTGDLFSLVIYGHQMGLQKVMQKIGEAGKGAILLLRYKDEHNLIEQTINQLSYQQSKKEPVDPYIHRFNESEQKDVGIGAQILNSVGVRKVKLLTNNPRKRVGLYGYGIEVIEEVPYV